MAKAYSYLRFSTPEQMKGDSFRRQTQLALDYCRQKALTLDTEVTYNDLGVSAFRGKNAEAGRLGEFLEAVKEGLIESNSYLLVESLDRISRQAARKALRILESICDEGITVVTLSDGKAYTREALDSDPMSLIMSLLVFIRANEESATKSRRLKAAWVGKRLKVASGDLKLTAKGPGWLRLNKTTNKWEPIPERVAVVRRIFEWASKGMGTHAIAEKLNSEGAPIFGSGKLWHRSYVLKILWECPQVIGTLVPHVLDFEDGKKVRKPLDPIPNYYPAVVPAELYQQVQTLRGGGKLPGLGKRIHNIFAGMVRCGRCGGSMTLQNKGQGNGPRHFVCVNARYGKGCKYTALRYDEVEEMFLQAAPEILGGAPLKDQKAEENLQRIEVAIGELEEHRGALSVGYERTHDPGLLEKLTEANEELKALKSEREGLLAKVESISSGFVSKRSKELLRLLKAGPQRLDRTSTNTTVRAIFTGLSLNPDTGVATLGWRHGGTSQFTFGFPQEAA